MSYDNELAELRNWLNQDKRDFAAGLQLFIAYIDDKDMRPYLVAHRNEDKLYNIIRDRVLFLKEQITVNAPLPQPKIIAEVKTPHRVAEPVKAAVEEKQIDDVPLHKNALIVKLDKEWKLLRAEQGILHTQMSDIGLDNTGKPRLALTAEEREVRKLLAEKLVSHDKRIFEIWTDLNYVEIHGVLPVADKKRIPDGIKDVDFKVLKNQILPGISKQKKKIKELKAAMVSLTGKRFESANSKLTKWEKKLEDLETQKLKFTNG